MKKIVLFLVFILMPSFAMAKNIKVQSLSEINSSSHGEFSCVVLKNTKLNNGLTIPKDSILNASITDVVSPKSVKRNGYMTLKLTSYNFEDEIFPLEEYNISAKTTSIKIITEQDLKKTIKKQSINLGFKALTGFMFGSSQILQVSKGLLMPEEGKTRVQSAVDNVIDELPTKYLKKGSDLQIKEGDIFILKLNTDSKN